MLRFFTLITLLFILSSCVSTPQTLSKNVIPGKSILSEPLAPSIVEEGKYNIALLSPLGKQQEHIGSSLVKSAQLAIEEAQDSSINLLLINSDLIEQNPGLLNEKLKDNNVKAIIGPVYTKETVKLLEILKGQDIPVLSLSNDSSIKGDSLLIMGNSPDAQATILTNYAIGRGIKHFHLLVPSNKYGKLIENAVAATVSAKNGVTYSITWYNPEDSTHAIDNLVASIATTAKRSDHAIFMPQGGNNINSLNTALEKHQLKIHLIGSQAWDHQNILNFPLFDGAILLQKNALSDQKFFNEYNQLFHSQPTNIDLIAYNSLSMLIKMIKNNQSISKQSIIQHNPDSFDQQGISLYKMPIVEVQNKQFRIVE